MPLALLLDWGAGVCPENIDRNLPIHLAAMSGHINIIRLLIHHGGHVQLFASRHPEVRSWLTGLVIIIESRKRNIVFSTSYFVGTSSPAKHDPCFYHV